MTDTPPAGWTLRKYAPEDPAPETTGDPEPSPLAYSLGGLTRILNPGDTLSFTITTSTTET